jgi:hypothetical protein
MDHVFSVGEFGLKAACLAHFSLAYSKGETLLADLQGELIKRLSSYVILKVLFELFHVGSGGTLTDPEIATGFRIDKKDNNLYVRIRIQNLRM